MIRIAMISYHTCPLAVLGGKDTGGMNVYVRELTKELGREGIHVDVFTRSQDEHVPHVLHDLGYGNRVVHIPAGPEVPLEKKDLAEYIPTFVDGVLQFAEQKGIHYDLIHSHYWMSGVAATQLAEAWQVPVIQMFHTLGELKNRIAQSEEEKEGAYRLDGENLVIHSSHINKIIAATPTEKQQLIEYYSADPAKIEILPPGVDTDHFYDIPMDEAREFVGIPKDDLMILFVGRIEALKGIDTLLHAMSCMHKSGSNNNANLVIIGGDPSVTPEKMTGEMAKLRRIVTDLKMDNTVLFLGKKNQDSLPYYYSAANVLVMPSHYESFGMVALEAMACGTPVIASNVGGLSHLVQDEKTGYLVPNGDWAALCDKLTNLVENTELQAKLGNNAKKKAVDYAWPEIARKIIALYNQLCSIS